MLNFSFQPVKDIISKTKTFMSKKELSALISALATLAAGHVLAFFSYFQYEGVIHDSVQWYFSQCLIYAGSFFSIGIYTNYRLRKHKEK